MSKILFKLKNNRFLIIVVLIISFLTFKSFMKYFNEYHFGYAKWYYEMIEVCKVDSESDECKQFEIYERGNPKEIMAKLDTISLASEAIEMHTFTILHFLGPLLMIIVSTASIHREINTGMVRNYMTRMNYKSYLKRIFLSSIKYAWLFPLTIVIIVLISGYITNFNFVIDNEKIGVSYYSEYRYNNYFIYTFLMCVILFLHSVFHSNLGLICCKKNKNFIVSVISSYMLFTLINLFFYIVVGGLFVFRFLGINDLGDYFSLTGYWFFRDKPDYILIFVITLFLVIVSYIFLYLVYRKKEGVLMENEKNNS